MLRSLIAYETRVLAFVVLIACTVSAIDLLLETFFYASHLTLGLFVPLIVTNCAILASVETFASRNGVLTACVGGLARGAGLAGVLFVVGLMRELVGFGSLASLFGRQSDATIPLALLPPGAFFALAVLLVLSRWISLKHKDQTEPKSVDAVGVRFNEPGR